jgi:hypothetical protein
MKLKLERIRRKYQMDQGMRAHQQIQGQDRMRIAAKASEEKEEARSGWAAHIEAANASKAAGITPNSKSNQETNRAA